MSEPERANNLQEEAWGGEVVAAGRLERMLWFGAGANAKLLMRCPNSDRVKYQGLGGVVWATAVLAFASGSYAFYTVFSPKTETALDTSVDTFTSVLSIVVGIIWAGIIFNLDRFIVSSAGKGDGTDAVTWQELKAATPRMLMALLIGFCISAPLEIRILKPEIDQALALEQKEHEKALGKDLAQRVAAEKAEATAAIKQLEASLAAAKLEKEKRRLEIETKRIKLEEELAGRGTTGKAGAGPTTELLKQSLKTLEDDKALFDAALVTEEKATLASIDELKAKIAKAEQELNDDMANNRKQAKSLDGLLNRVHISHRIGGFVPWMITLMLLAIEISPLIFKMMLTKGVYDYLEENEKKLRAAYQGVIVEYELAPDVDAKSRKSKTVLKERFLRVERVEAEESARLESEKVLTEQVHESFRERRGAEIKQNPAGFMRSEN